MDYLWSHSDEWDCQILLILIYSGLRVNELLRNTAANVNLDEHWIYVPNELAKNKTSVRYVPIHDKVYPLVMEFYNRAISSGSEALMTNPGGYPIAYNNFATRNLKRLNTQFETKHRMHDTRHTFATNTLPIDSFSSLPCAFYTKKKCRKINVFRHPITFYSIFTYTLERYSPVLVSILITSP